MLGRSANFIVYDRLVQYIDGAHDGDAAAAVQRMFGNSSLIRLLIALGGLVAAVYWLGLSLSGLLFGVEFEIGVGCYFGDHMIPGGIGGR